MNDPPGILDTRDKKTRKAINRAIGDEICRLRNKRGLSRAKFVKLLPSRIVDRTLLAYEHGLRSHTVLRLLEICEALQESMPELLRRALQRAKLHLDHMDIKVDVRALLNEHQKPSTTSGKFRSLDRWARNRLNNCPEGTVTVTPSGVQELAASQDFSRTELVGYLSTFAPDSTSDDAEDVAA